MNNIIKMHCDVSLMNENFLLRDILSSMGAEVYVKGRDYNINVKGLYSVPEGGFKRDGGMNVFIHKIV